jgi:hypothetical protein
MMLHDPLKDCFSNVRLRRYAALLLLLFLAVWAQSQPASATVPGSKNTIIVIADTTLDSMIFSGFSTAIVSQLEQNLAPPEWSVLPRGHSIDELQPADSGVSVLLIKPKTMASGQASIYVTIMPLSSLKASLPDTLYQPLVNFVYTRADTAAAALLVAKKIAENLRGRFACRLLVNSVPSQAMVRSATGLSGVCPVQWDVAFGIIDVEARKKGYLPKTLRLNLSNSRKADTAVIELSKRRLYHSPAFYPAVALAFVSASLFGCEYYYYQKYRRLDGSDLKNNPDAFDATFGIAQNFEYGAGISLGLAGVLFCVTFFW